MKNVKDLKLFLFPLILIYKVIIFVSYQRKKQLIFFSILLFINSLFEVISVATLIPLLAIYNDPDIVLKNEIAKNIIKFFGLSSHNMIIGFATLLFGFVIIISVFIRLNTFKKGAKLTALIGNELSTICFKKIINQSYLVHLSRNSSEVVKTLSIEIQMTITSLNIFLRLLSAFLTFILVIFGMIILNPSITLISILVFGGFYLIISKKTSDDLDKYSFKVAESNNKLVKQIQEVIGGIRDVILNNKYSFFISNYKNVDKVKRNAEAKIEYISIFPYYTLEGLGFIILAVIGMILTFLLKNPSAVLTLLGTFAIALQKLLRSMQQIYYTFTVIRAKSVSIENVYKTLLIKNDISLKNYKNKNIDFNTISLEDVSFGYLKNKNKILNCINLEIKKGDVIGITGSTGSGKSTLIDIVMGLIKPDKGEVLVDGRSIHNSLQLKKSWFNSISHVPQSVYLLDGTIMENIAFGEEKKDIDIQKVKKSIEVACLTDFINSKPEGLYTIIGERGSKLSGGQAQRIAIARAIYKKSKLLVLDEATSALDNAIESRVMDSINKFDKNITIIMIAHRLSSLSNCNKRIKVDNRKISYYKNEIE